MSEKKMVRRSIAVTLGIICVILVVSLVGAFAHYMAMINDKNETISSLNSQVTDLQNQITSINSTISSLSSQVAELENQVISQISQLKQYLNATFTTGKTGKAIQIQSIALSGTTFHAYVQNVGDSQISLVPESCLYINGTMYTTVPTKTVLNQGETSDIVLASSSVHAGDLVTVKVASADGTFSQVTQQLP
jgi:TolA-binding protein